MEATSFLEGFSMPQNTGYMDSICNYIRFIYIYVSISVPVALSPPLDPLCICIVLQFHTYIFSRQKNPETCFFVNAALHHFPGFRLAEMQRELMELLEASKTCPKCWCQFFVGWLVFFLQISDVGCLKSEEMFCLNSQRSFHCISVFHKKLEGDFELHELCGFSFFHSSKDLVWVSVGNIKKYGLVPICPFHIQ